MVSFSDISTEITTNWGLAPGVTVPNIYDKDLKYSTKYKDSAFVKTYNEMPVKPISQSNNAGLIYRKQIFTIHGVYGTYTEADTAVQEFKRIITEKNGWFIGGTAKISQSGPLGKRHVFLLPCYEKAYLQKGAW